MTRTPPDLFGTALPLVAAPMAGGPSTTALAAAVSAAGGFAFLAGGYKTADALAAEITKMQHGGGVFGVNLFAPSTGEITESEFRRYAAELQPDADRYHLDLSTAALIHDDDSWADKLDLLLTDPVPVVSVTFGLPIPAEVTALQKAGSRVLVTVTTVEEARAAAAVGVDGLIAQGSDAGGHSGTHDPLRTITPMPTSDITRAAIAATGLPVVAAGGVAGPADVQALLTVGASAVAIGTLLLRTDEAGTNTLHTAALADPRFTETVITRAFTGRPARALRNQFTDQHTGPAGYPAIHHLTRTLRQAATTAGNPETMHLWAGTGYRNATTGPAGTVLTELVDGL